MTCIVQTKRIVPNLFCCIFDRLLYEYLFRQIQTAKKVNINNNGIKNIEYSNCIIHAHSKLNV